MKKRTLKIIVITLFLSIGSFIFYFIEHTEGSKVKKEVLALVKNTGIEKNNIGFELYNITNDEQIYSLNKNKDFSIASIKKIFTAKTILDQIAPSYVLSTIVSGQKPDKTGVIKGSISIVNSGDPLFSSQDMENLVSKMHSIGIRKINGDIILEDSLFRPELMYKGTPDMLVVSPIILDLNVLYLKKYATKNGIKYADKYGCMDIPIKKENAVTSPETIHIDVETPINYYACALKRILNNKKIKFLGNIKLGAHNRNEPVLLKEDTNSISTILRYMLKESSNLVAEQMIRIIYAHKKNSPIPADSSGVLPQTKASPSDIIKMLNSLYKDKGANFVEALPTAGIDGTLKHFNNEKIKGRVKAKTGTLPGTGVRGIAGYIELNNGVYSFVIIADAVNSNNITFYEQDFLEKLISILEKRSPAEKR